MSGLSANLLNDFYILYLNEGFWTRPNIGGYIPPPRYSFAMACNECEESCEIILLGGKTSEAGSNTKQLYMLEELFKNEKEVWGERNE